MIEHDVNLVLGCGEQGLDWLSKRPTFPPYLGLDKRKLTHPSKEYVLAEARTLPFQSGTFRYMYADFYLNPIGNGEVKQVVQNPEILLSQQFPVEVQQWFQNDMKRSPANVRQNLAKLRWLLRSSTFQEMWRVLALKGTMTIVDKAHVCQWVIDNATSILHVGEEKIGILPVAVTSEDWERSWSLQFVTDSGESPAKLLVFKQSV